MNTLERIHEDISRIEREEGFTILSARDTGSHAWGIDGPNSDRDIRLIFTEEYNPNCIDTRRDNHKLNAYSDEEFEYNAWSLRRFGELLRNSNPSALLFASSTQRYIDEPIAFDQLCGYALETFNPSDAIGAHRGKAKTNYWKYLLPTLKQRGETKQREFPCTEYEPEAGETGFIQLESLDNGEEKRIHATQIGSNNWKLIHEEQERHTWFITTPYDDPEELNEREEITAKHADTGEQITLETDAIASPDATQNGNWEFRWGTNDRTIKRYIYICEALLRADIIANTQRFPPAEIDSLITEYENLPQDERYTDIPIDTLREYADKKRNGEGYNYTPIPSQNAIDEALDNLLEAFQDPDNHRKGPNTSQINEYIRQC